MNYDEDFDNEELKAEVGNLLNAFDPYAVAKSDEAIFNL